MSDSSNTTKRAKPIDGDEQDVFSRYWRRHTKAKPGERARIKRKVRRRERQAGKSEVREW